MRLENAKRHFAPVADGRTRVLILGSLPGEASLAARQYYAHPRNAFWPLVGRVTGIDLTALPYEQRLEALKGAGIGLWDVVARAERTGSLDQAIRNAETADLNSLIAALPALKAVAFNGRKASAIGRQTLNDAHDLALIDLPSSSPAHAGMRFEEKASAWAALKAYLV